MQFLSSLLSVLATLSITAHLTLAEADIRVFFDPKYGSLPKDSCNPSCDQPLVRPSLVDYATKGGVPDPSTDPTIIMTKNDNDTFTERKCHWTGALNDNLNRAVFTIKGNEDYLDPCKDPKHQGIIMHCTPQASCPP